MSKVPDSAGSTDQKIIQSYLPSRTRPPSSSAFQDERWGGSSTMMDLDDASEHRGRAREATGSRPHSRSSSWHSHESGSHVLPERPKSASAYSQAWSQSDSQSAAQSDTQTAAASSDNPLMHAAYRLFKASVKAASDKFGPYLPPDDGSPFLAHRLTRMWNDLSSEQKAGWYARAAGEASSDFTSGWRSPLLNTPSSARQTPPSTGVSASRASMANVEGHEGHFYNFDMSEHRSPASLHDEEPLGAPSTLESRSQSPLPNEESGPSQSHIPRPPNAWILFRSTMSKSRRPDGAVYSPPEISVMWKELSKEERDLWYDRAKEAKLQHEAANPGYKYQPNRKVKKPYPMRIVSEMSPSAASSSSRSGVRPTHPGPSSPPWHTLY